MVSAKSSTLRASAFVIGRCCVMTATDSSVDIADDVAFSDAKGFSADICFCCNCCGRLPTGRCNIFDDLTASLPRVDCNDDIGDVILLICADKFSALDILCDAARKTSGCNTGGPKGLEPSTSAPGAPTFVEGSNSSITCEKFCKSDISQFNRYMKS
ncbi:uncharacterized protein LOC124288215 [Haliotis rubra]|uniref:uncharacterized protein LOC124288215 n=1 Tax=Haliotis rubra TaxID=36100 RepID=UPI001EE5FD2B|nr:uncharacterized protein LOC124288215 [Haliotis rubra]